MDDFKILEYEKYGFRNVVEREILRDKAVGAFKAEVIINAREGKYYSGISLCGQMATIF